MHYTVYQILITHGASTLYHTVFKRVKGMT